MRRHGLVAPLQAAGGRVRQSRPRRRAYDGGEALWRTDDQTAVPMAGRRSGDEIADRSAARRHSRVQIKIWDAKVTREGAIVGFFGNEPFAEQGRVGADPALVGDLHRQEQRPRRDALFGEEGDLGREFAALAHASRAFAPHSGRVAPDLRSLRNVAPCDRLLQRVRHATKLDNTRTGAPTKLGPAPYSPSVSR